MHIKFDLYFQKKSVTHMSYSYQNKTVKIHHLTMFSFPICKLNYHYYEHVQCANYQILVFPNPHPVDLLQ